MTERAEPSKKVGICQPEKLVSQRKKAPAKCRRKVVDGSDADSSADVPTLAPES